jgi:hypothetical protein
VEGGSLSLDHHVREAHITNERQEDQDSGVYKD